MGVLPAFGRAYPFLRVANYIHFSVSGADMFSRRFFVVCMCFVLDFLFFVDVVYIFVLLICISSVTQNGPDSLKCNVIRIRQQV